MLNRAIILKKVFFAVAVVFGMFVLPGCGIHDLPGCGGCGVTSGPGISPGTLIYPMPGATAIPDAGVTVVVAAPSSNAPLTIAPALSPMSGPGIVSSGSFVAIPNPLPTPHLTVPTGDVLYAFTYTALAAHMTYTVVFPLSTGCVTLSECNAGSFTTR